MLRKQPRVESAIVTTVNGSRFFDMYIPSLGLEARINVIEVLPTVDASWNAEQRYVRQFCVLLAELPYIGKSFKECQT